MYIGMLMSLAMALIGFPPTGERFILRPSWCPPSVILSIVRLGRWIPAFSAAALVFAAAFPNQVSARATAALFFSIFSLQHHAVVGTHYEQLANWGLWAMVLPTGPTRGSVLRIIVAHHIGAAGYLKARVGGLDWVDPRTMIEMCKEFAPAASILKFVQTGPRAILLALGWGGLLSEAIVFPCAVILARDTSTGWKVLCSLIAFHAGTFVLVSMFFVHNIPIYAAALLLDTPTTISSEAWTLFGILSLVTIYAIEDWPFSHMGLFPYSGAQLESLADRFGGSLRLIGSAQGAESVLGRELRESGAVDIIAWTLHASVPTAASQWEGDGRFGVATFWALSWLNLDSLDLRQAPFAAAEVAAKSIGESKLIWDTSLRKPLTHFFAARLEKGGGGALVIKEIMASVKSIMPGEKWQIEDKDSLTICVFSA